MTSRVCREDKTALFLRSYQFEAERKYNNMDTKELSYEVIESIGVISEKNSYTKEVNIISSNGRPPEVSELTKRE